eukprot:g1545.t1
MTELIEEPCERSPFDFVTDDEHRFVFDEGDALMIECAIELTPFDGLLLAGFVEAGSDSCDDDDATDLTGARIWPGAGILAHFIAANPNITRNRAIVELGAGAGVCGLASARRAGGGACRGCVLTDGSTACVELCKRNIARNQHLWADSIPPVDVTATLLRWGSLDAAERLAARMHMEMGVAPSLVLASEVIYDHAQIEPFFATARALLLLSSERHGSMSAPASIVQDPTSVLSSALVHHIAPTVVLSLIPRCDYNTVEQDVQNAAYAAGFTLSRHVRGKEALERFIRDVEMVTDAVERNASILVFCLNLADVNTDHASALTQASPSSKIKDTSKD